MAAAAAETASIAPMRFAALCDACGVRVLDTVGWFECLEPLEHHLRRCAAASPPRASSGTVLERFVIVAHDRPDGTVRRLEPASLAPERRDALTSPCPAAPS